MVGTYITALWSDVVARMSGIASLVFTALGTFSPLFSGVKGLEYSKEFCWAAAAICFALANFMVWRREHQKVLGESPAISMRVEQVRWELGTNNTTVLVFAVHLLNSGAPSVTHGWNGSIKFGQGGDEALQTFRPVFPWIIRQDGQTVTLRAEDEIIFKTLERRLETGEARVGRAFYILRGDRIDQLRAANFTATLTCLDFKGKVVQGKFVPHGALLTGVQLYPGEQGAILPGQ
jgi:hypothetical protein